MDAAVLNQSFQGSSRHFTAHGIERADHDDAGRIVDNDVHASRLFECTDVASFATDHASLHLVRWDVDSRDGAGRGVLGCVALNRGDGDLASFLLGGFLGIGDPAIDESGWDTLVRMPTKLL